MVRRVKERVLVTRSDGHKQHYHKWVEYDDEEIRIVEWTMNFVPTKGDNRPSSNRDWEVRIQAPEDVPRGRIRAYAEEVLADEMSEMGGASMVDSSSVFTKVGADFVETTMEGYIRYKIIDKTRPQYRYPKNGWGEIE